MAKKKRTSVSGRKRGSKKEPKWLSSFKHGFYTACFVVVIASAALYIYQVASPYVEKWDWGKKESSTSRFEEVLRKQLPAPKEKEQAKKDMANMLDYIDMLNELDTEGVEPMSHVFPVHNVFREDIVVNGDTRDQILKNAPEQKDGSFMVPKTVD